MKQILQNIANGETSLAEVPCPQCKPGNIMIKTHKSLLSIGTEKMLINFGKAGWIEKARSQPDKVKMVLDKVKTDGISATYDAIKSKLDQPIPLGYCNVGTVLKDNDAGLKVGTRVVSNGNHAEVVRVPKNLVVEIPEEVDDESASFTVLGAIALQGIRLINPTIGEKVVVTGLGLIGLIAVQILKANGCNVLGIDYDSQKCELAKRFGAQVVNLSKGEDPLTASNSFSRNRGVDAVLITASSRSNDIMSQAATMCRKRGRIVLVGVVGLELNRADFYEKEISFQVSCSYGPGRYDKNYEDHGNDYPLGFVRWTEQRNFEAILDLIATGSLDVKSLISHKFSIEDAISAYNKLDDPSALGILLEYHLDNKDDLTKNTIALTTAIDTPKGKGNIAFIGAGNYASRILIPAFKKAGANFTSIITSGGISAIHHGNKNGFTNASTDLDSALDDTTDAVIIATQHNQHAEQAILALQKGKHVFVEKPLALTLEELKKIKQAQKNSNRMVMVGFNRRFSPQVQKMKALLNSKAMPKTFIMTINSGEIPVDHWTQDTKIGGGRILGEACHFIDLMRFLTGSNIKNFTSMKMGKNQYYEITEDKAIINLQFEDGSVGSINYFSNGSKSYPKERIEVFCDNAVLQLDNFRKLTGFGWNNFKKMNLWTQDKGQENCSKAFLQAIKTGTPNPIPQNEIYEVAKISIEIAEALR